MVGRGVPPSPEPREPERRSEPTGGARCHCWGGQENKGWTAIGIFSLVTHRLSDGGAPLGQATDGKALLAWVTGNRAPLCGLCMAGHLMCGLRALGG